jgi:uncharacterized protein (TIGR03067 family)
LIALVVAAAAASAGFGGDEKAEKEKKKLAGTWALVSGVVDGKPVADEHVKQSRLTRAGAEAAMTAPHQSKEPIKSKHTHLDPVKKPAEMDWVRAGGPGAGKTMMAIYEWLDEDTYRICFDPSGKVRPTEFKSAPGSGHILHVWKRVK